MTLRTPLMLRFHVMYVLHLVLGTMVSMEEREKKEAKFKKCQKLFCLLCLIQEEYDVKIFRDMYFDIPCTLIRPLKEIMKPSKLLMTVQNIFQSRDLVHLPPVPKNQKIKKTTKMTHVPKKFIK